MFESFLKHEPEVRSVGNPPFQRDPTVSSSVCQFTYSFIQSQISFSQKRLISFFCFFFLFFT